MAYLWIFQLQNIWSQINKMTINLVPINMYFQVTPEGVHCQRISPRLPGYVTSELLW